MELITSLFCVMLDLVLCIHSYYLLKCKKIKLPLFYTIFPIAIPFLGYLLLWLLKLSTHDDKTNVSLLAKEADVWTEISGVENKNELGNSYEDVQKLIPLEEALLLQDKKTARWMLMEMVSRTPDRFIDLLFLARKDKDTEVVHYATTLIAEVSRQYDVRLQNLNKKYHQNPSDFKVLTEYCTILGSYLQKGLVTKRLEKLLRKDYSDLLAKKIRQKEELSDYLSFIKNELLLKHYKRAKEYLDLISQKWTQREEIYMLYLQYYYETKQGERIKELIKAIEKDSIYISKENRERLAFWHS
ncbi:hypothetical protein [Streptococcus anginosus]|uniref:Uncharacterized protein n=1 Tax=Streptococcus anginosus subsp. whileyi CCUG 39159 TaxID=1095729 RepID=I0SHN8_STRAP|nr:hypothetical protein [Streptococcus anginosus]AGU84175.1 putative membrane protein [Streptococcus anginosus C238]EID22891.1 hypothetical protein HMPREF1043_0818 [Streptococcus anginosus subsp. whileyi CCUG 39159]MDB8661634.1 hypothetical protein [Streptococcus anginosus]MDP1385836.1 hypothetical protein [Streptococcus anginosus]QQT08464.1 hypothetical protein I6J12_07825 [Streptococcus anginosus]